ncbi:MULTISPECIES: TrbI F-type domain-containing protein [Legionella]|uniref:TrbI F-type domain-containing protein n=1 Tax=Legionella TaxID=445 RepID=UPI001041A10A|nr:MULTISPECIES: TrbI F-type domain-containing protein [Legionella]
MRFTPLILGCALALLSLYSFFYGQASSNTIVTFDREGVLSQFIRQLAEVKASESQVEHSTRRFNEVLRKILVDLAKQKRVIILSKKDVLAGGLDITDEVRMKLSQAMRNKS